MAGVPIQQIAVPSFEYKEHPTQHVVYAVQITMPDRTWTVYRRYTDFCNLHEQITPPIPPAPLPPKHRLKQTWRMITGLGGLLANTEIQKHEDKLDLEIRRAGLEKYLRAIVASPSPHWRETDAFMTFVDVQEPAWPEPSWNPRMTQRPPQPKIPLRPWRDAAEPARETNTTRPMTDAELLRYQTNTLMHAQDEQANALSATLRRQHDLGIHIHHELNVHHELLEDLHNDVQHTQGRMDAADARMKQMK